MKAATVLETIGNTPHIRINRLFGDRAEVWMKSERANPGGSIKDRIALAMIEDAERSGKLKPGGTIIEPTSGNTGIGLAMVAAVKGYKLILVMPESMSLERRRLMLAYGATFDLTAKEKGMSGAVARAQELIDQTPNSWMPQQFDNPANVEVWVKSARPPLVPHGKPGTGGMSGLQRAAQEVTPLHREVRIRATETSRFSPGETGNLCAQQYQIGGHGEAWLAPRLSTSGPLGIHG